MSEEKRDKQRRLPRTVAVGAVVALLALIGLVTLLSGCVQLGRRLLDNSRQKEEFQQLLFPVVMFDPATIESPEELDQLVLLRSSIWSAYTSNMEKYSLDSNNRIYLAKSDVDVAAAKLFGPEIQLEHQSFSDYFETYYYDEEKETYLAPLSSSSVLYTPQVEEIEKSGVIYTLTVGYLESGKEWLATLQGRDYVPSPAKYMIYTLKKVDDHYQLVSIQQPAQGSVPGVPDIPQNQTNPSTEEQTTQPASTENKEAV